MSRRVAIVGLAFRFPGTTAQTYWSDLLGARSLVTQVDPQRWPLEAFLHPDPKHPGSAYTRAAGCVGDVAGFDADFFGISPREAALMDPQQRVLLELCWEAMENAGIPPASLRGSDCGVYVGIASTDYAWRIAEDLNCVDATTVTGMAPSIAANRLSYFYDLRGPSMALDTACSSSMVALHQACRAIASGECSQAIAGGISLHLHPYGFIGFTKAGMLSPRGQCSVFDAAADGYVRSEGGGLFLLKDYEQARLDGNPVWAVVAASAVNTDGRKPGLTIPSAQAQIALMRSACAQAGIAPADIDYLEAHGTGTPVGDPIEAHAIGVALGQPRGPGRPLPVGSVKSNMGHLETASGVAGLVKAVYALRHRVVPATIGVKALNPNIRPEEWNIDIVTASRPLRPTGRLMIGVNSFGFGGANAHVILESAPDADTGDTAAETTPPGMPVPLIITGKTHAAVRDFAARLADTLRGQPPHTVYDAAYQLAWRRQWHPQRAVVFAADGDEASAQLRALADGNTPAQCLRAGGGPGRAADSTAPIFVYSGNGAQWAGMGRRLLLAPVFAAAVAEIDAVFQPLAGYALADELLGKHGDRYEHTEIAQPALFAVQVGITRMLAAYGIAPAAVIGHSVGEVAAAWACRALTLADAVRVIYHRSRLQGQTKGQGQMTAVGLGAEETQALLETLALTATLHLAGANSARGATVAGAPQALAVLEAHLAAHRVAYRRLQLDYAFHSPAMDVIAGEVQQALAGITPRAGEITLYSTVTGAPLGGTPLDGSYWWRNIRMPVQFASACTAAIADGHRVFVEIGPHAVLRNYLNDALQQASHEASREASAGQRQAAASGQVIVTASRDGDEPERIAAAAGQIIASGARVDWPVFFPQPGRHIDLPAYAWQREHHWHPVSPEAAGLLTRQIVHPLLGYALAQHENTWQQQLDTQSHPTLADHVVGGAVVFPGAGYAELALAAARQWQCGDSARCYAEIEELDIRAPLLLAPAPSKIVRLALDGSDGRLRIVAKDQGTDAPWTLYATGRVLPAPGAALLNRPALRVPTRKPDFSAADHAALTRLVGLDYGPAFQAVAHGWREATGAVLVALAPHASLAAELARMHLHPALLDCAFQLLVHLLDPAMGQGIAFVPVKLGRLALHADLGQPRYARVQLGRRAPRSLTADITLYGADGAVVAAVQDARFRGVRLHKRAGEQLVFLDAVATPRPLPGSAAPATLEMAQLRQRLAEGAGDNTRFHQEVEPLLESLCDRYALDALAALAAGGTTVDKSVMLTADALATVVAPERAALLQHVLERAVASGSAQALDGAWALLPADADSASAADIWNTLLREYPDDFPAVHAAGRTGLHLSALLQGPMAADAVCPAAFTPARIDQLALGAATLRHVTRAVTATLSVAQNRLPRGQRLAVCEIGSAPPLLAAACAGALDPDLADIRYATPDGALAEQVQRQFMEARLHASVEVLAEETTDTEALPRHDLVIVHGAFASAHTAQQALAGAAARLKPGGILLLLGRTPAPWVDMLFGARDGWWSGAGGPWRSAQQSAQDWQASLQALGLACEEILALTGDSGTYALMARQPPARDTAATGFTTVPRGVLLLANADGASHDLARALQNHLLEAGHHCHVALEVEADQLEATLHSARQQLGNVDAIVHLDGWGAAHAQMSAQALTQAQVQRCALAAALAQACARTASGATLWLLTSGATLPMRAAHCAPSTAPQESLFALNDAALWGYGRTLINEAEGRVRLLDLPADATPTPPPLLEAVARELVELAQGDAEDEILLDASGARYAARLRERPRPQPPLPATHAADAEAGVRLGFEFPGQLRHLRWEAVYLPPPAPDEVHVRIHASGLNFRDVMYALGLLSDEAVENGFVGPTLGLEFSGVVARVGKNVTGYQPGDAVLGFGPASFATGTLTQAATLARIPPGLSFEAAATLPSVFFTVYYALHHLARLQAGETILIHGAAGGVGIAAIQYAQACGAHVYASAGSAEKRDFLRLMGVRHIYDSRALGYADEILADTKGLGVDVVLNSLAGEAINRNFRVLKPFGRFLELGKRDFYENTHIGLRPFRNNISYFGIDADQLMRERPDLTQRLFADLMDLFAQGQLHPLPYTAFDASDVVPAFRHMQQAGHIGKIVITYASFEQALRAKERASATPPAALRLPAKKALKPSARIAGAGPNPPTPAPPELLQNLPKASYLVTGGLAGFGLRTAQWLADKGARHLILVSRSGARSDAARAAVAALQAQGVHVHAAACDVADCAALAALLQASAATMPPLKGIVHAAAVIQDALATNATPAQIAQNLAAKVLGARHLHALTRHAALDFCLYYSSATTLFGNPGQSAYIAANTWLESLAAARRAQGLPATCVRWGPIDDVGFLARNARVKHALQERLGGAALTSAVALQVLEDVLLAGDANAPAVLELDWRALRRFLPGAAAPKFADLARHVDEDGQGGASATDDIAHLLATLDDDALHARMQDILKAELGEILRIPAHKIDTARPVYDMGLDSLMGVELVVALENRLGIRLPVMALQEQSTLEQLARHLVKRLREGGDAATPADEVSATVAHIAASHAAEVPEASIAQFVADMQTPGASAPPRIIR